MSITIKQREQFLKEFLQTWPVSRLETLTLREYIGIGDKNTLAYWLEFGVGRYLGSIKGGDSSKFGIYERGAPPKGRRDFIASDDRYSWKVKYGTSADKAFAKIKEQIILVIDAVKAIDIDAIEALDFESALKWKLAFIYQDHRNPSVLPIYKLSKFRHFLNEKSNYNHAQAYTQIMARRGNKTALEYGFQLWQEADALEGKTNSDYVNTNIDNEIDNDGVATPLNQIFYGPPGSGKTYVTIESAVTAAEPSFVWGNRDELKARYDQLVNAGRIRFVTFHQSYSYEDFVEGLAATSTDGKISYENKLGVFRKLVNAASEHQSTQMVRQNYVLVIDEINRGNISRIFGELITLIEPSKRIGAPEALEVTLPLTGDRFGVPDNLYIIGTMNTADRSLAGLDLALRRRFTFHEMPSKPELLDNTDVEGINIGGMLRVMNQRITVLLDRDHCIGHAYFMPLIDNPSLALLADIFAQNILPLLQEYFFEDWQRIRWVLADQEKLDSQAFIVRDNSLDTQQLFPGITQLKTQDCWQLNLKSLMQVQAYQLIYQSSEQTQ